MIKSGIYAIKCIYNNKVYIGKSINISARKYKHFELLKKNRHHNKRLQNSYNKYGNEFFNFYVLEYANINELSKLECKYIDIFNSCDERYGFNIKYEGSDFTIHSEESKILMWDNTKKISKPVYGFCLNGILLKKWDSISSCAIELSVNPCDVRRTIQEKQRTCKGYVLNNENLFRLRKNKAKDNYKNFFSNKLSLDKNGYVLI